MDVVKGRKRRVKKLGIDEAMRMAKTAKMENSKVLGEIDSLVIGRVSFRKKHWEMNGSRIDVVDRGLGQGQDQQDE